jgi:cardiolipin synthase
MARKSFKKRSNLIKEENIWNIPNTLTFFRVIIAFILFYLIIAGFDLLTITIVFAIGMITDFLDGQIARRFNQVTEFGRKFDMIADRILMIGTVLVLVVHWSITGELSKWFGFQILLIMSREIIALPFVMMAFISGNMLPQVRFIGKATTFCQGVAFPLIILNMIYPQTNFSIYAALVTCIVGVFAGLAYIKDFQSAGMANSN